MAAWFGGLSSSLGHYLEQTTHHVVSLTRYMSSCTKDVWMMESSTEESNELKRKEVETTKESITPKVEIFMTFYSDVDLENKQKTPAYNDLLKKGDLHNKLFIRKETFEIQKLQNLQEDTQSGNAEAGFVPATSSTLLGENIDPKHAECKHELEQKNLEMMSLRERYEVKYHKLLKLQKATESKNGTTSLQPATPASITLGDNINQNASEYEHQLKQQNLKLKILRGKYVATKHKLFKLQKATECLNAAAGLLPVTSSALLGENIDPSAAKYEHDLEQKILEMKILRGRNVAMKHKLLKLQRATECLNAAAGLLPVTSSASLGENINSNAAKHEQDLEQKNLEVKILRGRNVAMKYKLLKLQKAIECLNVAAGLLLATSSASLGEKMDPDCSEHEHELEQKNLEVKILRGRKVAMKHKLLKLQKATECLNPAAGLLPVTSSASLGENIDPSAAKYEHDLEQKILEIKILRGQNVAMKHKLLKLQRATECLNAAAGLLPVTSSASLGENINSNAAKHEQDLEQKNLEVKILRGRNVAMEYKLLKLQKAIECLNAAAGLLPVTSSVSLGENIDPSAAKYEHDLEQKILEMKILRGQNVAMKHKLLKLQRAIECLNAAAGLLPVTSSASLGENIDPSAAKYEHDLEQKILEMKILRGRNVAMKHKLLKLQRATECLNAAAGLLPVTSSASLGENINSNAAKHEQDLEQKNLEVKILRGRNVAMEYKLLKLQKAIECLNAAAGLLPVTSSVSLGENIDPSAAKYEHDLEQKILEMKILRGQNVAMKHKLLKLQRAIECLNAAAGLLSVTSSASLGENINSNAAKHEQDLEQKNLEVKILRGRNVAMKYKLLKLQKAIECLNAAAGLLLATSSASLGENIDPSGSKDEHELEQKNLEVKILRVRNVAMMQKLLKLQRGIECLNMAAGLLPVTASALLSENIHLNAPKYEHELQEKNLEVKILRGRNVAMKHKLLKLQRATACLNEAAGLLPITSSALLGEDIDPNVTKYEHDLEQKNLEMKILRGRNVAMKYKLLKLRKATECLNAAASLLPASSSASLGENIDPSGSKDEHDLEQNNLEVKILRGRNVAMKHKLLKLQRATECLNAAAGLLPVTSSASLGENIDHNASKYEHDLEKKSLEVKILRGRNVAMKLKFLKLRKAIQYLNVAAGIPPAASSASLDENIDHNAAKYERDLEQNNLELKILRGQNVAMKHKLLKIQRATEYLNAAAGFLPVTSSASLGENIDPNGSQHEHDLEQKNLEVKILRGRNVAMKHKLLKIQKATECLNEAAGFLPVTSSASVGENIDPNAAKYEHALEQKTLEMKILRGRNVAMKLNLLKLQNATERLNAASGLLPVTSSASVGENIDHNAAKYERDLEQNNLEVKILRGQNVAMKLKLLKLRKATECLNAATGLLPAMSSASPGENIDPNGSHHEHELEQKNLEVKILRGRNVAMKLKLLKVRKATQRANGEVSLVPAMPASTSLGDNMDSSAS